MINSTTRFLYRCGGCYKGRGIIVIELKFDKLYRYPRIEEHAFIAIPLKKGKLKSLSKVAVLQDGKPVPMQGKVTSRWFHSLFIS